MNLLLKTISKLIKSETVFLYPPSKDSMIQVTASNFKSCNTKDPILYMNDGNSLFNLTQNGTFYFTSGQPGHCQKYQKLIVSVGPYSAEADALSPSSSSADADAPSYQNAFGSIPLSQKSSSSSPLFSTVVASLACAVVVGALMWKWQLLIFFLLFSKQWLVPFFSLLDLLLIIYYTSESSISCRFLKFHNTIMYFQIWNFPQKLPKRALRYGLFFMGLFNMFK